MLLNYIPNSLNKLNLFIEPIPIKFPYQAISPIKPNGQHSPTHPCKRKADPKFQFHPHSSFPSNVYIKPSVTAHNILQCSL